MYIGAGNRRIGALGQTTGEKWYRRAKTAMADYEALYARAQRIASKEFREDLLKRIGTTADTASPAYAYAAVESNVRVAESAVPTNYALFEISRRQKRIERLEGTVADLRPIVADYEKRAGLLPPSPKPPEPPKLPQGVTPEAPPVEELFGLPVRTWLYILGGTAVVATGVALVSGMGEAPKKRGAVRGVRGLG